MSRRGREPGQRTGRLRLLGRRHRPGIEVAFVVLAYFVYESSRGILGGGSRSAVAHARLVFDAEQWGHVDIERRLQEVCANFPGLGKAFDLGYVTLHLAVTIAVLVWLYRRRAQADYVRLRTALMVASSAALLGFTLLPTAPPRLAGIGVADTVSRGTVNLDASWLHWLYNPYAALPSVHVAYAMLAGLAVFVYGRRAAIRIGGAIYPVWVAAEVMVTGNHFLVDVAAGAMIAIGAWWLAPHITATQSANLHPIAGERTLDVPVTGDAEPAAA